MDTMTQERRSLLQRMLAEQPERLPRKMRAAGHSPQDAEDLAQETLVRAVRSLEAVRGPAAEAVMCGWVDSIANNVSRNARRTLARHPVPDELPAVETAPPALHQSDDADLIACRHSLESLLAVLPPEQREVFVARALHERSTQDIALELGISEDLVRWRLRTARRRLREQLHTQ